MTCKGTLFSRFANYYVRKRFLKNYVLREMQFNKRAQKLCTIYTC